jgi:hypothetical protein
VCIKRNRDADLEWCAGLKGKRIGGKERKGWVRSREGEGQVFKMSGVMADINHVFQSASAGSRSCRVTES